MKKVIGFLGAVLFMFSSLSAQYYKIIKVEAGSRVIDNFPYHVRYLYPQFTEGQVVMKAGAVSAARINYNLLLGEIEFLQDHDTLVLSRKKDVELISVALDTFIYRSGYLKMIHSGNFKVCLRDKIKLKDIVKKGAMGAPNRTSSVESYNSIPMDGKLYDLVPPDDMEFQRNLEFYILTASGDLIDFKKKNILDLFPEKEAEIQKYLKSNKVNFELQADIIRFSDFLARL